MTEVASAYVTLIPSARGFGAKTEQALGGELPQVGDRQGRVLGGRLSGAFGGVLKAGVVGAAGVAGAAIGTALFKGFKRLDAIDQAKAKLTGLGNSSKKVTKIMDSALASVKGTAFGLDEAATIAASAVAAGVKPGQELQRTLSLVADAATIAGTDLGEMGSIFNKVATSNKVQADVLNQLGDRGIPIIQLLGKTLGKTSEQVLQMSHDGTIGFADFQKAIESGMGGAALASGKTFTGALKNVGAAVGRLGASVESGAFPRMKGAFGKITTILDGWGPAAKKFGDAIGSGIDFVIGKAGDLQKKLAGIDFSKLSKLDGKKLGLAITTALGIAVKSIAKLGGKIATAIGNMLGKVDWVGLGIKAGPAVLGLLVGLTTGLINGITDPGLWKGIWDHLPAILFAGLSIALAPVKVVGIIARVLGKIPLVGPVLRWIVEGLSKLGGPIRGAFTSFFRELGGVIGRAFGEMFRKLPGGGLMTVLRRIFTNAATFFSTLPTRFGLYGIRIGEGLLKGLSRGANAVVSFLRGLPAKFVSFFSKLPGQFSTIGGNIVDGLLRGLRSAWTRITTWLADKIAGLSAAAKKLLGITSPSKVFMEIGQFVGLGMAAGIESTFPRVHGAVAGMTSVRPGALSPAFASASASSATVRPTQFRVKSGTLRIVGGRDLVEGILSDAVFEAAL